MKFNELVKEIQKREITQMTFFSGDSYFNVDKMGRLQNFDPADMDKDFDVLFDEADRAAEKIKSQLKDHDREVSSSRMTTMKFSAYHRIILGLKDRYFHLDVPREVFAVMKKEDRKLLSIYRSPKKLDEITYDKTIQRAVRNNMPKNMEDRDKSALKIVRKAEKLNTIKERLDYIEEMLDMVKNLRGKMK